jgi:hypothetical protein
VCLMQLSHRETLESLVRDGRLCKLTVDLLCVEVAQL